MEQESTIGDDSGMDALLQRVVRRTRAHVGAVYLLDSREQVLQIAMVTGVSRQIAEAWPREVWAAPVAEAARNNRVVWLPRHQDIIAQYQQTQLSFPYNVAMCVAPASDDDTVRGALLLLWPETRPSKLTPSERQQITDTGHAIAAALARASVAGKPIWPPGLVRFLEPSLPYERGRSVASALVERLHEGLCGLDLDGRITVLNGAARHLLGVEEEPSNHLVGSRPWEALPWLRDPSYENPYLSALFSRLPTSFTALRPPDQWLSFHLFPDATGVSMRIVASDTPGEADGGEPFTPPPSAPTRAGALFYLLHLSSALTSAIDVADVTSAVTDQILPVINAQGMALMTSDEGRLNVLCSHGFPPGVASYFHGSLTSLRSASVLAMETGLPAFYPDNETLQRRYPHVALYRAMSAFCYLPLVVSGRVFGCCVLGYDRPRDFPAEERAALASLGGMIAQALARARLYDTTNRVARGLQAALLPQELPRVAGLDVAARYLPATRGMDIGGDFYDLIRVGDNTVVAVIGDVQGHNVSAAALMGQIRTTVRTHAASGAPPDEVLRRTNRLLVGLDTTLFASCLCAEIDLPSGKVRIATAGHLPPVVCHAEGTTDVADITPGILLGVAPDSVYATSGVSLTPGDLFVLFTDGLIERPDLDLDEAIGNLARELAGSGGTPLDTLADALMAWGRRTAQGYDDIALLLLRSCTEG